MSDMEEFARAVTGARVSNEMLMGSMPSVAPSEAPGDWAKTLAVASCWAQTGDSFFPVAGVVDSIPPGAYRCCMSNTGPYLEKMKVNIDHLLALPDSAVERLLEEFSQFWKLRGEFDKRGFTFKRGMLMWGPPGSGKTSGIWQMTQRLVRDHKGVVIFVEQPQLATWCLGFLQRIEPDRAIVTVMEDIDAMIRNHGEHNLLALLDGENQINNVVHIATTNYPHLLDRRFIDRPSRFDTIMKVGMPSSEAREVYFKAKEPQLAADVIKRWVSKTDGYSVAHLREVCIATQCFLQPEDKVFERLNAMRQIDSFNDLNDDGEERERAGFLAQQFAAVKKRGGIRI
jgi:predicted AAA+ superfamily ATPase